jgi:hypothetical protein
VVRSAGTFLFGAGLLALGAVGSGVGCNQLFGFEDRTAGPTWCEQDAQSGSAYCDDFDRVSQSTPQNQLQITLGGTVAVTSAEYSSPPNSLEVTTTARDASTLVGTIATLGSSVMPGQGVECQIDVPAADLAALTTAGPLVGVFGIGAAANSASSAIDLLALFLSPAQEIVMLEQAQPSTNMVVPEGNGCPIAGGLNITQALGGPAGSQNGWIRLTMSVAPTEGGVPEGGCVLTSMDGGTQPTLTVRVAAGPLAAPDMYVPAQDFSMAEFFAYGLAFSLHTTASTVHVDNARCQAIP